MNSSPQRIGIFGGSFDPVHNAHVALARAVVDQLQLDELRWVPTGQPWHKSRQISAAAHRVAMVELTIESEPRWRLERCELERDGPSYTLDTVRELQRREPGARWFLILGQDQYEGLPQWHGWRELLGLVTLAVARRPGVVHPPDRRPFQHVDVVLPTMDVSSTEIRQRLADGRGIADLVPPAVAAYIDRHRLYTDEAPRS